MVSGGRVRGDEDVGPRLARTAPRAGPEPRLARTAPWAGPGPGLAWMAPRAGPGLGRERLASARRHWGTMLSCGRREPPSPADRGRPCAHRRGRKGGQSARPWSPAPVTRPGRGFVTAPRERPVTAAAGSSVCSQPHLHPLRSVGRTAEQPVPLPAIRLWPERQREPGSGLSASGRHAAAAPALGRPHRR